MDERDLQQALPDVTGTMTLPGLDGPVEVVRDSLGVPHVRASTVHDAFFAQGYVHAQDRLWQMDVDRRRAAGRWAAWAGPAWVDQDTLLRRVGIAPSAQIDYANFDADTKAVFDAYAAGVNAFIAGTTALPVEYQLVGAEPEPWQPWDGCSVYKVRHVLMGTIGAKLWRARILQHLGPQAVMQLRLDAAEPGPVITMAGVEYGAMPDGTDTLAGAELVAGLSEWGAGSNNWAVHGSRTASGLPLVAGDPHRPLEVPNVYYQNHVACPEFDVIGYSFAGIPGFPHFGHNAHVAWCITHGMADYDDLYIERFAPGDPTRYEFRGEWREATHRRETIDVRGGSSIEIDVIETHHGPVVIGDPAGGHALSLRYSATCEPNAGFTTFLPMLRARSVAELDATMRAWVDPVNNMTMADTHGTIGYLMRGQVPIRTRANSWLPVPGWTGEHEWQGNIPFDELPRVRDPQAGYIATANNRIVTDDYPYHVALDWAHPHRAMRLAARLAGLTGATVADMAAVHADRVSLPSRVFTDRLPELDIPSGAATRARDILGAWDATMAPDQVAPTIYAVWREHTTAVVAERTEVAQLAALARPNDPVPLRILPLASRLRAPVTAFVEADDTALLPDGTKWNDVLSEAFVRAVEWLTQRFGQDMGTWTWGRLHRTAPVHTLAGTFPELAGLLNPPDAAVGGDGDTPQAASYEGLGGVGFTLTATSVARYCFDVGDWDNSGWVSPLGASGHPGSAHFADQVPAWTAVQLHPMRYSWDRIDAEAVTRQHLQPAGEPRG